MYYQSYPSTYVKYMIHFISNEISSNLSISVSFGKTWRLTTDSLDNLNIGDY